MRLNCVDRLASILERVANCKLLAIFFLPEVICVELLLGLSPHGMRKSPNSGA